jgi:hypothetical protein
LRSRNSRRFVIFVPGIIWLGSRRCVAIVVKGIMGLGFRSRLVIGETKKQKQIG